MSEIADRYRRLAADFTRRARLVPSDRWDSPTPCEGWSARRLMSHMVDSSGIFFGLAGWQLPEGPSVDDDPVAAWEAARDAVQDALDDPGRASTAYEGFRGPSTFEKGVDGFLCTDLIVHSWDLARATGLDERLDPADVAQVAAAMEPMGDALRGPGAFGPAVEPPEGADAQTRLLCFLGREV